MASKVSAKWIGDFNFEGRDPDGQTFTMAPVPDKGKREGLNPMEMLLMAMAGCTGMDVAHLLEKKRQKLSSLIVEVTGEKRKKAPYVWDSIFVRYVVEGDVTAEALKQATTLSMEKYCSVGITLGTKAKIDYEYEIR